MNSELAKFRLDITTDMEHTCGDARQRIENYDGKRLQKKKIP
jgi:hypothetical protein